MEIKRVRKGSFLLVFLFLCACSSRIDLAPVEELFWQEVQSVSNKPKAIVSSKPSTLDLKDLKHSKDFKKPASKAVDKKALTKPVAKKVLVSKNQKDTKKIKPRSKAINRNAGVKSNNTKGSIVKNSHQNKKWLWPAKGKIAVQFDPQKGKKGINIRGKKGERIFASKSGIVVYEGDGLQGYGNLIIIKHNNQYLTAYANNLRNLIKEGDKVKEGQVIAEMGVIDRKYWGLHFEIRKAGVPINPLTFLRA